MKINILFSYYSIIYDWAVTTSYCLRKLGIESDVYAPSLSGMSRKDLINYVYPEADYYIIINQAEFFLQNIPDCAKKIYWFTEPIDFTSNNQNIKEKGEHLRLMYESCDFIVVPEQSTKIEAENNDIHIDYVMGIGYDEIFTKYYNPNTIRDIEIYFEGGVNTRRREILDTFSVPVTIKGYCGDPYHYMLSKAKIALNIHSYDAKTSFGFLRIITAISEGALVISETINMPYPFINGQHLIMCDKNNIADVAQICLNEKYDEGRIIANNAYDFIKNSYCMKDLLYNFIKSYIDSTLENKNCEAEIPIIKGR